MAIEDIKQMTRPLSEGKKVAQHAPEDYLKRAVEQFIIEFPEFEDLDIEDLYKEMDNKGWFSDEYASSDYGIPITPEYRRQMLLDGYGSHRHGYSDHELKNMDDDEIREIYDELNEMFRDAKLKQPKDIQQVNQGGIVGLRNGGDPRIEQQSEGITQLAAYPMGYPGRAEEDMERAYDDYQKKHMLGTPGYESPLFDEDGIIQIDPSTVFGLWMES